ncbi:MAG: hypothetical protein NTW74_26530 [Acidobacteria bacterium]|nr:hypothetical protein [Acidobacteriota bacterium]
MKSALDRFKESMAIDYAKWREGEGYDLEVLKEMAQVELQEVESLLIERLRRDGDWRDVEALVALDTETARAAVLAARKHQITRVRNYAVRLGPVTEADVVRAIESAKSMDGLDASLRMAENCNTAVVRRALLDMARSGDSTVRVHMVAMLYFLMGKAESAFDWQLRPYFLEFGVEDNQALRAVWNPLRAELEEFELRNKK